MSKMKNEKTARSTSKTESETQKSSSDIQPSEFQQRKNKKNASIKSLIEDKTETYESTAHEKTTEITTPKQQKQFAPSHAPAKTAAPTQAAQFKTPMAFSGESTISPTSKEELPPLNLRPSQIEANQAFLKKVDINIDQIESDQSDQFSWIRKLVLQKWMTFLDTFLAGFTLLFFTIAFYFIFHINPTLELKLTPEFRIKVRSSKGFNSFEKCNHFSGLKTDNTNLPVIDDNRCFNSLEYGRFFSETFKTSTPNATNECEIDRVEIFKHPCYTKTGENDPMNIFWGVNVSEFTFSDYICSGYVSETTAFNSIVNKYSMMEKFPNFFYTNRIVSSAALFFQCPTCALMLRIPPPPDYQKSKETYFYEYNLVAPSIPKNLRDCLDYISTGKDCHLDSRFFRKAPKTFSAAVFANHLAKDLEMRSECYRLANL